MGVPRVVQMAAEGAGLVAEKREVYEGRAMAVG
jgi:hypothetical protein